MTDAPVEATSPDETSSRPALDEAALGRAFAIGVPVVTVTAGAVVGAVVGAAPAILVLTAGGLLGAISVLWASVRLLSGDAPLPPELEALDRAAHGVDALSARRKMLVRSIKDLENEHALGKLEDSDFEQLSSTYRAELKELLKRMDAQLAPHREKAEALARAHLARAGIGDAPPVDGDASNERAAAVAGEAAPVTSKPARRVCPKCEASNESDAKFCKECATPLVAKEPVDEA